MYNSPIEKIFGEIQNEIMRRDEEHLLTVVSQNVGYVVDKTELVKALQYDRSQYEKGYADAKAVYETKWIHVSEPPKTDGRYLAYIVNDYDSRLSYIMVCDYLHQTWCPDDETASNNVIYWMPLPADPYNTESE